MPVRLVHFLLVLDRLASPQTLFIPHSGAEGATVVSFLNPDMGIPPVIGMVGRQAPQCLLRPHLRPPHLYLPITPPHPQRITTIAHTMLWKIRTT